MSAGLAAATASARVCAVLEAADVGTASGERWPSSGRVIDSKCFTICSTPYSRGAPLQGRSDAGEAVSKGGPEVAPLKKFQRGPKRPNHVLPPAYHVLGQLDPFSTPSPVVLKLKWHSRAYSDVVMIAAAVSFG